MPRGRAYSPICLQGKKHRPKCRLLIGIRRQSGPPNSKVKSNASSGLKVISVQNVSIANSVIYNNGKSGIYLNSSTANIRNSVLRKNVRMGLILSNSSLTCDKLDIDSNSVDGMFVGGSSTLTMTNSSLKDNTGFGIETSEYIFNYLTT